MIRFVNMDVTIGVFVTPSFPHWIPFALGPFPSYVVFGAPFAQLATHLFAFHRQSKLLDNGPCVQSFRSKLEYLFLVRGER